MNFNIKIEEEKNGMSSAFIGSGVNVILKPQNCKFGS